MQTDIDTITKIFSRVRTISVSNLSSRTGLTTDELSGVIKVLAARNIIRLAQSRGCHGACSSCSSCAGGQDESLTGDEIIISMLPQEGESHADD